MIFNQDTLGHHIHQPIYKSSREGYGEKKFEYFIVNEFFQNILF
jgi:hypothetical protein